MVFLSQMEHESLMQAADKNYEAPNAEKWTATKESALKKKT